MLTFRKLDLTSIAQLLEIQEEAFATIEDTDILRRNTHETFAVCFAEPSLVTGVFDGDEMVAFGILYAAGKDKENLAYDLDGCDDVTKFANIKLVIVRQAYRGRGLQRALIRHFENYAIEQGFVGLCSTASPKNIYSCNNLKACGYTVAKTLQKYGGKERWLFVKRLKRNL